MASGGSKARERLLETAARDAFSSDFFSVFSRSSSGT